MKSLRIKPDTAAFNAVLKSVRDPSRIPDLLQEMRSNNCGPDATTYFHIVGKYLRHSRAIDALAALEDMRAQGVPLDGKMATLWIRALAMQGANFSAVAEVCKEVETKKLSAKAPYYTTLLSLCAAALKDAYNKTLLKDGLGGIPFHRLVFSILKRYGD